MIKINNVQVFGIEAAIRGMRNPKNSWDKSDSSTSSDDIIELGPNDLKLAKALHEGGPVHSKYKRMIHIQMDVDAPIYWWKEYDTYKVSTTANSCSTMHKIHAYEINRDMFSTDHLSERELKTLDAIIVDLEYNRKKFLETNDKEYWYRLIQSLPMSFNQMRTLDFSYETGTNILMWRYNHKLDEWREFCKVLLSLPYAKEIMVPVVRREEIEKMYQ